MIIQGFVTTIICAGKGRKRKGESMSHYRFDVRMNAVLLIAGCLWCSVCIAQWSVETVYEDREIVGCSRLVYDGLGRPSVSFFRDGTLVLAVKSGDDWSFEEVVNVDQPRETDLAFTDSHRPWIAFSCNEPGTGDQVYAMVKDPDWLTYHLASPSENYNLAIQLDSGDHPHVFFSEFEDRDLLHVHKSSGDWETEIVDTQSDESTQVFAFITPGDDIRLCYEGYPGQGGMNVKFAQTVAGSWASEFVLSGRSVFMSRDSEMNPWISALDRNTLEITLTRHDGYEWTTETVHINGDETSFSSLMPDAFHRPHVIFENLNVNGLTYAFRSESGWVY